MQRLASLLLILIVCGSESDARMQQQVRGQVVNRDGAPQQCEVNFYADRPEPAYRVISDRQGYFYLTNPGHRGYRVVVVQGSRQAEFSRVTIDDYGLHPATLVVQW